MNIKNYLKLGFVSATICFVLSYGGYSIYTALAQEPDVINPAYKDFTDPNREFVFLKISYHDAMNDYFNKKLEDLHEILKDEYFYKDRAVMARLNPPPAQVPETEISETGEQAGTYEDGSECPDDNLSAYCVSIEALNMYIAYINTLNEIRKQILTELSESRGSIWIYDFEYESVEGILMANAKQNEMIDEEIEKARQVMEATVSAYNEFKIAYPMHVKYVKIIDDLKKYRRALQSVTRQVERFPGKFIDSSSVMCE